MRRLVGIGLAVAMVLGALGAPAAERKVVVPGIHAHPGVPEGSAEVIGDLLLEALLSRHGIRALGPSDIRAVLSAEQQKQLLGCSDESCMVELAGALGADWLVAGTLGRLDDLYVLNLMLIEAGSARVTARASGRMTRLKEAVEAVGPLLDSLLQQRPRRPAASVLPPPSAAVPPAPVRPQLSESAYCRALQAYAAALSGGPWAAARVEERRALLEDLVRTPFRRVFDHKRSCFWELQGRVENELIQGLRAANTAAEALDARRRIAEFGAFYDGLKLLEDEYPRGLEMEKNGAGSRLQALPFVVAAAEPEARPTGPAVEAYERAYGEALPVLAEALKAAAAGQRESFLAACARPEETKGPAAPGKVFEELGRQVKSGFRLSVCPLVVVSGQDVQRYAARLAAKGELTLCWRRTRDGNVFLDDVVARRADAGWRIEAW